MRAVALGYVAVRIMESVFAAIGLMSLISVVSITSALSGATGSAATALTHPGQLLGAHLRVGVRVGLVADIGNGLLVGYLMYRSGLVPRRMALLGLIGGSLLILNFALILAAAYKNGEGRSGLSPFPKLHGAVPRHLLRMEGLPAIQRGAPTRHRRRRRPIGS